MKARKNSASRGSRRFSKGSPPDESVSGYVESISAYRGKTRIKKVFSRKDLGMA